MTERQTLSLLTFAPDLTVIAMGRGVQVERALFYFTLYAPVWFVILE